MNHPWTEGYEIMGLTEEEQKRVIKEALQEWLDKQFALFGKWTLAGIISLALAGGLYLWLISSGWHR